MSSPGTASNVFTGGGGGGGLLLVCGRPTVALSSALVTQTLSCLVCVEVFFSSKNKICDRDIGPVMLKNAYIYRE